MAEKVCSVEGCATGAIARGLCRKHYQRHYRHGDTAASHARPGVELPRRDEATGRWVGTPAPPNGRGSESLDYPTSPGDFINRGYAYYTGG
jgi:hypothetical protein